MPSISFEERTKLVPTTLEIRWAPAAGDSAQGAGNSDGKRTSRGKEMVFRRKIKKNKRKALTGLPSCLICNSLTKGELHEQRESDKKPAKTRRQT